MSSLCENCIKKGLLPRKVMKGKTLCSRCNASSSYDGVRKEKQDLKKLRDTTHALELAKVQFQIRAKSLEQQKTCETLLKEVQALKTDFDIAKVIEELTKNL